MAQDDADIGRHEKSPAQALPAGTRSRGWIKPVLVVLALGLLLIGVTAEFLIAQAQPMLRASVIANLSARFHSPVALDRLDVSLMRGVLVRGSGLRILYLAGPNQPASGQLAPTHPGSAEQPMLTVQNFTFRISLRDLLHMRARVARVTADGVQVLIPPHSLDNIAPPPAAVASPAPGVVVPSARSNLPAVDPRLAPRPVTLAAGIIVCRNVKVIIQTSQPGKDPLELDIADVQLNDAGTGRPMMYAADLINPRPVGKVHVFGHFGPWQGADPRATALDGIYSFQDANLSTIKGLSGTLSSTGNFSGQLGHAVIQGSTSTPDFALDVSQHPEPLYTRFQAIVDGTSGDTTLTRVDARLKNSSFVASGTVKRIPAGNKREGHDIAVAVDMPHGRIEDLLQLGMKTNPQVMRGSVALQANLHIPPGSERVAAKMQLTGSVAIAGVSFSNVKLQDQVDALSLRAQGKPRELKTSQGSPLPEISSRMQADISLANSLVTVHSLTYQVPGATVLLDGVYSLDGNVFEFKGHVRTQAKASQMVGGWKGWLLKPVDPFLEKNGAGVELPIGISGTQGDVKVGLAMHDSNETTADMAADLKQRDWRTREQAAAHALAQKADREDLAAAREKDLGKAEQIHNLAVRDREQARRNEAATSPAAAGPTSASPAQFKPAQAKPAPMAAPN